MSTLFTRLRLRLSASLPGLGCSGFFFSTSEGNSILPITFTPVSFSTFTRINSFSGAGVGLISWNYRNGYYWRSFNYWLLRFFAFRWFFLRLCCSLFSRLLFLFSCVLWILAFLVLIKINFANHFHLIWFFLFDRFFYFIFSSQQSFLQQRFLLL
jgi:hypothetical protein